MDGGDLKLTQKNAIMVFAFLTERTFFFPSFFHLS